MPTPLKDLFFQESFVKKLSSEIEKIYPNFKKTDFVDSVLTKEFKNKALKAKMRYLSIKLKGFLPKDYKKSLEILKKIHHKFSGFDHLVFDDFVEKYGLAHFEDSINALEQFTKKCSSEFAIRPFIEKYPQKSFRQLKKWAVHKDPKVRRLASEGCRPRLPWGKALKNLKKDPTPILPILETLKNDQSETVRKSVANNLNDISKDHPDLALKITKRWLGKSPKTDRLVKHALRGLLKKGNSDALNLFGFGDTSKTEIANFTLTPPKIKIGEKAVLSFNLKIKTSEKQKIRLEYIIDYIKKTGNSSPKIFQLKEAIFAGNKSFKIKKSLSFKNQSTRKLFPGKHKISLIINGKALKKLNFDLVK